MANAWQVLRDGGLPLAVPSSGILRSAHELAIAARTAIAEQPTGRDAEALAAFLFAWHHEWPASFAAELGSDAPSAVAWATHAAVDDNRYLKLRRIAIENLAKLL